MSGWNIFKTIVKKKISAAKGRFDDRNRQALDEGLPLDLNIDSKISLDLSSFIIHGDNLLISLPEEEYFVAGVGKANLGGSRIIRFYLESEEKKRALLQVVLDSRGEINESRLFTSFDEIYPASNDDWALWLQEDDGLIGWIGFQPQETEFVYDRAWDDSDSQWVEPVEFSETIILDKYDDSQSQEVRVKAMLYGRWVDENKEFAEYMLVAAEEGQDGAVVHVMAGIDLDPAFISKIY